MHETLAGRPPIFGPDVAEPPQWRCTECVSTALRSGRWCALCHQAAAHDPRAAGIVNGHQTDHGSPWATLAGLLSVVPDAIMVSVCQRPATPDTWLVLLWLGAGTGRRDVTERAFDGIEAAVAALTDIIEGIITAESASVRP